MLGGLARRQTTYKAAVVVAVVCLVAFVAWCCTVVVAVSKLRAEVDQRVRWMQMARHVEQATVQNDRAAQRIALETLDAELPALLQAAHDDPALRSAVERTAKSLRVPEDVRDELQYTTLPGVADLVPALRRQTAVRSLQLGEYWDSLYMLVGISMLFAGATLTLLIRAKARHSRSAEHNAAQLHAQLLRSDRLAALGTLAATVAHEINNPLSSVLANLDVLEDRLPDGPDDPELRTSLEQAREGIRRAATIVRDLRRLSRPDRTSPFTRVDINKCLSASIRICEGEARDRARIVREYGRIPRVHADDAQLRQVFLNLLVNAVQAIPPGAPDDHTIRVRTQLTGRGVRIDICDTGPGIDPRHVDRLFEPFVTTKDVAEGTGLGLYVCRSIVESLQGQIELAPISGGGTRATVVLPDAPATDEASDHSVPIHDPTPTEDRHLRILIVDDEEMLATALARSLRGHEVHTANHGVEALEASSATRFDLILCDLIMPGMTGMEVFEAMVVQDPSVRRRFVFMTGATLTEDARAFAEQADAPVLEKPFSRSDLVAVLDRFL